MGRGQKKTWGSGEPPRLIGGVFFQGEKVLALATTNEAESGEGDEKGGGGLGD